MRERLSSSAPWWEVACPHCGRVADVRELAAGDRLLCTCDAWLELARQGAGYVWRTIRRPKGGRDATSP
jgi:hypothetical protein